MSRSRSLSRIDDRRACEFPRSRAPSVNLISPVEHSRGSTSANFLSPRKLIRLRLRPSLSSLFLSPPPSVRIRRVAGEKSVLTLVVIISASDSSKPPPKACHFLRENVRARRFPRRKYAYIRTVYPLERQRLRRRGRRRRRSLERDVGCATRDFH